ncbi:hypothetical protein TMatcc_002813 [Talaromyces marneffei ATCC 18224]
MYPFFLFYPDRGLGILGVGLSPFRQHRSLASTFIPIPNRQIHLLSKSKLAHEISRPFICFRPFAFAVTPGRGIVRCNQYRGTQ